MNKPRYISFSIEEKASRIDIVYEEDGTSLSLYQGEDELFSLSIGINIVRSIQKIMEICPVDWKTMEFYPVNW